MQRFKSVKACRPKSRRAKANENSSANSLKYRQPLITGFLFKRRKHRVLREEFFKNILYPISIIILNNVSIPIKNFPLCPLSLIK
ncbi:MAG: hypothetical protein LBP59_16440 [Planctomycetaceae bacterium]|nr:hypothetical protein [Planctomycetaceae bacterium]